MRTANTYVIFGMRLGMERAQVFRGDVVSGERVVFELIPGIMRKLTPISGIEGSLVVTERTIAFIGPAASHPLKGGVQPGFSMDTPLGVLTGGDEEESDLDRFIDFRKGMRSLHEQIAQSEDIEEKIAQLRKYRQKSVRIRRKSIRDLQYTGGKLRVTGRKDKYTFIVPKNQSRALESALREFGYVR